MASGATGPVAEFCAALRELQRSSGISRPALARQLHYGRSQLYEILDGRIRRPPEWDRLVEPLVRACLSGSLDRDGRERTVADWRRRHDVLIRVYDELNRHAAPATLGAPEPPRLKASRSLLAHSEQQWSQLAVHPFVQAVARGELSDEVFRKWLVNDHHYNVEYQRFIAGLAGIAPTDAATEAIATAMSGSRLGLSQLRDLAERFVVDLDAEPEPATVGLAAFLQAQVSRGYPTAMSALYAAEKAYVDTWSAVRPTANRSTPYWFLLDYWSSDAYGYWSESLGRLIDAAAPDGPTPDMYRAFNWVVRLELQFFGALYGAEP
jgi:formylaminopyrimidine deformylase / aminopyrimidine aminohydrolase